ncbi:MAG TPA: YraN family protein [Pyrinomonadaceae bacterium]|nr:YraN family protein [Pyrinomonadaceae bacterium]
MASSRSESSPNNPHDSDHFDLGQRGEAYAAAFLEQRGYRIVGANFSLPVGRNLRGALVKAEIDLVAYDGPTLCFIEVKTRSSDWFAPPQVNIDLRKRRQIARAARSYRRMFGLEGAVYRFDVVTVVLPPAHIQKGMQIELLRNYWSETSLRKRKHYQEWYYD